MKVVYGGKYYDKRSSGYDFTQIAEYLSYGSKGEQLLKGVLTSASVIVTIRPKNCITRKDGHEGFDCHSNLFP